MDLLPSLWCQVAALNRLTGSTSHTTCLAPGADGSLCVGHGSQLSTFDWTLHLQQSITTNLPQVAACAPPLAGLETAGLSCTTQSQCTGMPAQQISWQIPAFSESLAHHPCLPQLLCFGWQPVCAFHLAGSDPRLHSLPARWIASTTSRTPA